MAKPKTPLVNSISEPLSIGLLNTKFLPGVTVIRHNIIAHLGLASRRLLSGHQ